MRFFEGKDTFWECYDDTNIRRCQSFKDVVMLCVNANFYPTLLYYKKRQSLGMIEKKYKKPEELTSNQKNEVLVHCLERDAVRCFERDALKVKNVNALDNSFKLLKNETGKQYPDPKYFSSTQNDSEEFKLLKSLGSQFSDFNKVTKDYKENIDLKTKIKEKEEISSKRFKDINVQKLCKYSNNLVSHNHDFLFKSNKGFQEKDFTKKSGFSTDKSNAIFMDLNQKRFTDNENKFISNDKFKQTVKTTSNEVNMKHKVTDYQHLSTLKNQSNGFKADFKQNRPVQVNINNQKPIDTLKKTIVHKENNSEMADEKTSETINKSLYNNSDIINIDHDNQEIMTYSDSLLHYLVIMIILLLILLCFY